MATTPVVSYRYFYGGGSAPNRRLDFYRKGQDPKTIKAVAIAIIQGAEQEISEVTGEALNVEMMSSADKVALFMAKREGKEVDEKPDQSLGSLSVEQQNAILNRLEPNGPWRVEIENSPGRVTEVVEALSIFQPVTEQSH